MRRLTKFPFRATINGRACTVSRFIGAYLFVYDDDTPTKGET